MTLKKRTATRRKPSAKAKNVVRIMSIHKSKGLEFSTVFCVNALKINFRDTSGAILLHKTLGLGLNFVDYEKRFFVSVNHKKRLPKKMTLETLSEEERIFVRCLNARKRKSFT
ncbi:MAG: hypothetical protein L6V93_07475 [Clostridiales bacterium]|nr:MAG: hypothetical protein L6V93_07475 [Clostridiales bacterium]